jgi:Na+/H+-dicarboxylate symporter
MPTESPDTRHPLRPHVSTARLVGTAIGAVFVAVFIAIGLNGQADTGDIVALIALFTVFAAALLYVPNRGDITSIMTGETDERQRMIDLRANWYALQAVVFTTLAGYAWEIAHDRSGLPFIVIALVSSATYTIALFVLRSRS